MFQFQKPTRYRDFASVSILLLTIAISAHAQSQETPLVEYQTLPLPSSLPRDASLTTAAYFAWNQFLFLNSKAAPVNHTTPRGTPDPSGSLGAVGETLVWQTWAHKVELRPNSPLTTPWNQLGVPNYQSSAYQNPEQPNVPVVVQGDPNARWDLWNNLDEDNEIGSCNLYGKYQAIATPELVLYQVKVNKDEYEYIRTNFGSDQQHPKRLDMNGNAAPGATQGGLYRAQKNVTQHIRQSPHSYYQGAPTGPDATCDCPPNQAICLPCGGYGPTSSQYPDGAIEIKSAWRRLTPYESPAGYYTTEAIYYDYDPREQVYKYYNDTFALIGIHIIRKLAAFPDFVFTTFEHNSVAGSDYEYYLLDGDTGHQTGAAVPVMRQQGTDNANQNHRIPSAISTVNLHVQFHLSRTHPGTVWTNYRLTGVQTRSGSCEVHNPPSSTASPSMAARQCRQGQVTSTCIQNDPNYYMANFVIESDPFVNNFSGPGFGGNTFGDCSNTVYNNATFNNGGCKGCHGVAQTAFGTDFSFLLDFGNEKPATKPDAIHYRPEFDGFQGPLLFTQGFNSASNFHVLNTLEECVNMCRGDANCNAATYFAPQRFCWNYLGSLGGAIPYHKGIFKSYVRNGVRIPPDLSQADGESFAAVSEPQFGSQLLPSLEFSGDDMETAEVPASERENSDYCHHLCLEKDGCQAYSDCGGSSKTRTCHLKGSKPTSGVGNSSCTSGFVVRSRY